MMRCGALLGVGALLLALAGCGGETAPETKPPSIVLGVTADTPLAGELVSLHVVVTAGQGERLYDEVLATDGSGPIEIPIDALPDGTRIVATLEAFGVANQQLPLIKRRIETLVEEGRTILLRVRLNDECIAQEGERDISCPSGTCSAGVCVLPFVAPDKLADYTPSWNEPPQGNCGLVDQTEPIVVIGREESPFSPLEDGDVVTPQMGLQGASHFFFGVRMNHADDASTLTHFYARILSTGRETNVVSVADVYTANDGGCELFWVPLILPPEDVANEVMRLGVTVADGTGNAGHAHVDVVLAEPLPP